MTEKCDTYDGARVCLKNVIFSFEKVGVGSPVYFYEGGELVKAELLRFGETKRIGNMLVSDFNACCA